MHRKLGAWLRHLVSRPRERDTSLYCGYPADAGLRPGCQCELSHVQDCMREAAAAAAAGAAECAKLQLAFAELSEEERRQKKALANRSYENRMSLNTTRAQLREHRGKVLQPPPPPPSAQVALSC